mgnify:CR=1 FL=1
MRFVHGDRRRQGGALLRDAAGFSLEGKQVTTLEGLGTAAEPAPIQRAFIEEQAAQCGYCIAGMMMRAQALLQRNAKPTDDADPRRARGRIFAAAALICASCARCIARAALMDTADASSSNREGARR